MQNIRSIPGVAPSSIVRTSRDLYIEGVGLMEVLVGGHENLVSADGLNSCVHIMPWSTTTGSSSVCIRHFPSYHWTCCLCAGVARKCKSWCTRSMSYPLSCLFWVDISMATMGSGRPGSEGHRVIVMSIASDQLCGCSWVMGHNWSCPGSFYLPFYVFSRLGIHQCPPTSARLRSAIIDSIVSCSSSFDDNIRNNGAIRIGRSSKGSSGVSEWPAVYSRVLVHVLYICCTVEILVRYSSDGGSGTPNVIDIGTKPHCFSTCSRHSCIVDMLQVLITCRHVHSSASIWLIEPWKGCCSSICRGDLVGCDWALGVVRRSSAGIECNIGGCGMLCIDWGGLCSACDTVVAVAYSVEGKYGTVVDFAVGESAFYLKGLSDHCCDGVLEKVELGVRLPI